MTKGINLFTLFLFTCITFSCTGRNKDKVDGIANSSFVPTGYQLIWNDEFDATEVASFPDLTKWSYETGGGGWGNKELQYYVPAYYQKDTTAFVQNGILNIRAIKLEEPIDSYQYISSRMTTKENWKYGYFEARLKLPEGVGTWPAFWMLPVNLETWPLDGEIDIMEHVGSHPDSIHISIHTQKYNHAIGTQKTAILEIEKVQDEFHVYGLEWTPTVIKGFIDGVECFSYANDETGDKETWPFDMPFNVKLNMAVGGGFGGQKGVDDSCFPATFQIDYVRVYQKNN